MSSSPDIKHYLRRKEFYVKYNKDISEAPLQILYTPAIAAILPIGWVLGADLKVPLIDEKYFHSLNSIKETQKSFFPKLRFSNLIPEEIKKTSTGGNKPGLLFSGGLDSTYTYMKIRDKKPVLFLFFGSDIPLYNKRYMSNTQKVYTEFAYREQAEIVYIESNIRDLFKEAQISVENGESLGYISLWEKLSLSVALTGMTAPYTPNKINKIYIASSHSPEMPPTRGYGSHPLVDNQITWGDMTVTHVDETVSRPLKAKYIKENYIDTSKQNVTIRVCHRSPSFTDQLNCGECEKCRRTMVNLLMYKINPRDCGFPLKDDFLMRIKQDLIKGTLFKDAFKIEYWQSIQKNIPQNTDNFMDSQEFFDWFKDYNIPALAPSDTHSKLRDKLLVLVSNLPIEISNRFRAAYNKYLT